MYNITYVYGQNESNMLAGVRAVHAYPTVHCFGLGNRIIHYLNFSSLATSFLVLPTTNNDKSCEPPSIIPS